MRRSNPRASRLPANKAKQFNGVAKARRARHNSAYSKRSRGGQRNECEPFSPPEDWYEPTGDQEGYEVVVQPPGKGYRHAVTPREVRERLAELPAEFLQDLEVVQLSRMTRKKESFPCYGMQWGSALYLYPIEDSFTESFSTPPGPDLWNETRMYGGRWIHDAPRRWRLVWTPRAIRDFYLHNILIHELGHLLDERNSGYVDRERFAEWFAIEYGYRPARAEGRLTGRRKKRVKRHGRG